MRVYFIRHGESKSNFDNIHAGSEVDTGLTECGIEQAIKTGEYLASLDKNINYIYSSPMKRAIETAEHIRDKINSDLTIIRKKSSLKKVLVYLLECQR